MRKTFLSTLMIAALAFSSLALARVEGTPGTGGGHGGGTSAPGPSAPSGPQSNADGPDTRYFELSRKTQNAGFCERNPNDYYVRAGLAVCTGY